MTPNDVKVIHDSVTAIRARYSGAERRLVDKVLGQVGFTVNILLQASQGHAELVQEITPRLEYLSGIYRMQERNDT